MNRAKATRYLMAFVGPIGSAAAQFALSLSLLRLLAPAEFGKFAFLLVFANFSTGIWSALFCAPLPILLHEGDAAAREGVLRTLFSTNLLVAFAAGVIFAGMGTALGVPPLATLLFATFGAVALLRWFARAYAYATNAPVRTMVSDFIYSGILLAAVAAMLLAHLSSLDFAYGALVVSAATALLPFGLPYLLAQFGRFTPSAVPGYSMMWRRFSGWSLLGVLTTEATANSHAYFVTALLGPAAFAPIAASALAMRPMSVAINALTEFERAQMARHIAEGRLDETGSSITHFRWALAAAWVGTVALVVTVGILAPRAIIPARYDLRFVGIGMALWMVVAAVRMARTPESALLQGAGAFRPLAIASVISAGVSIVAVAVLLLLGGPLWSIVGIMGGELMYAAWIWRQARRWRRGAIVRADVAVAA